MVAATWAWQNPITVKETGLGLVGEFRGYAHDCDPNQAP